MARGHHAVLDRTRASTRRRHTLSVQCTLWCVGVRAPPGGTSVSDIDPAEPQPGRRTVHDPFDDDPAELSPIAAASVRRQEREGLPPSYRMRAVAHYVDQLTSRRGDRRATDLTRPPTHEVEAANGHKPPDRDRLRLQLMAKLAYGLGAIASAPALLAGDASPLARRANIGVI